MVLASTLLRSQPWHPDPLGLALPSGRTVHLEQVTVALDRSACRRLSFEYVSEISPSDGDDLRAEAAQVLGVAAADSVYSACRLATVVARSVEGEEDQPPSRDRVFTFSRRSPAEWVPLPAAR
jgi:hypothetical protein